MKSLLESVIMWEKNFGCPEIVHGKHLMALSRIYHRIDLREGKAYFKTYHASPHDEKYHTLLLAVERENRFSKGCWWTC